MKIDELKEVIKINSVRNIAEEIVTTHDPTRIPSGINTVFLYCPETITYSKFTNYNPKELLSILDKKFENNIKFIMQINFNQNLYGEIIKSILKTDTFLEYIIKIFDSKLDYCFNSLESILCFNISQITDCRFEYSKTINTNPIQFLIHKSGIFIMNKECNEELSKQIIDLFSFKLTEFSMTEFNNNINELKSAGIFAMKPSNFKSRKNLNNINLLNNLDNLANSNKLVRINTLSSGTSRSFNSVDDVEPEEVFSVEKLIYMLFLISINKIDEFYKLLSEKSNAEVLKNTYKSKNYIENKKSQFNDFMEKIVFVKKIAFQHITSKISFLHTLLEELSNFNSQNEFYFYKLNFQFYIESLLAKLSLIEVNLKELSNKNDLLYQQYLIEIEKSTQAYKNKVNNIMKILTIFSVLYGSVNIVPTIWGMNIKVPLKDVDNYWPFFGGVVFLIGLMFLQLYIFYKWGWS